jgi:hypothetical protein
MKLKTIISLIQETYGNVGMGNGSMSSNDTELKPYPGSMDDVEDWEGIREGQGWFLYREATNNEKNRAGASVYIHGDENPHKFWITIKTHGLRKPQDTNEQFRQRIKKHSDKVARSWTNAANKLHKIEEYNGVGNRISISWKEAFKEALNDPKVKTFIENWGEEPIKSKKTAAIADPVNFTPHI